MISLNGSQIRDFKEIWEKLERQHNYNGSFDMLDMIGAVNDIGFRKENRVITGLLYSTPTTASTQGGGVVAPAWRVNFSAGLSSVKNISQLINAGVDVDVTGGATVPALGVGQSIVVAVVISQVAAAPTTLALYMIKGAAATTGQQTAPTNRQILTQLAALGGGTSYVRCALLTLNRTGNTTVTQSQDNTWRDC